MTLLNLRQGAAALALVHLAVPASATEKAPSETPAQKSVRLAEEKRLGSLYLRCDGQPNNMPGMETFARAVALSLVVGLLLPGPEAPDPSKRLFGEEGVDACSQLLDGTERRENNVLRRIPLLLARGLHRIEAKDYNGAIADVDLARSEATSAGLVGNVYFDRSMGLSFNVIESEARLRMGDTEGAHELAMRDAVKMPNSFYAIVSGRNLYPITRELSQIEEDYYRAYQRIIPSMSSILASRLQENDRHREAAALSEALIPVNDALDTSDKRSWPRAYAAVAQALAGDWHAADRLAKEARENLDSRILAGKPESDRSGVSEVLDLYGVLKLAHEGRIDEARRNFAARTEWLSGSYGAVMATNTLLRAGAKPDQLFGALSKTADDLFEDRRKLFLAQRLDTDKNNKTLFTYIMPYARINGYEALSKDVWRTDKPRLIGAEPMKNSMFYYMSVNGDPMTQPDALLLHAAVQAKARGQSFINFAFTSKPDVSYAWFGKPEEGKFPATFALDPDIVIAELRQVIPSPEDLAARKAAMKKTK